MYRTSEVNFMKITEKLLVQFWVIIYITTEFNFMKKEKPYWFNFG